MEKQQVEILITNKTGLHARPASLFVQEANRFESQIEVSYNGKKVNAKSLLSILGLGAHQNSNIVIEVEGEDAKEAIIALKKMFEEELPRMDGEK